MRLGRQISTGATVGLLVATLVSAGASSASAGNQRGMKRGVVVTVTRKGGVVVTFTKAATPLYRLIAGTRVRIRCVKVSFSDGRFMGSASIQIAVPAKRVIRSKISGRTTYDYCSVESLRRCNGEVVSAALTQQGRVYLDERDTTVLLFSTISSSLAADPSGWRFLSTQEFLDRFSTRQKVVALPSLDATPPLGWLGYWSDTHRHAETVKTTLSGKRFFAEFDDDVLRTNVGVYLNSVYGCL